VVDGVGNPKADLSHFSAMADVQHGGPSNGVPRTGWLGRYLDGIGADPMHGVAIGSRVPLVLTGAKTSGTALPQQVEFVREGRDGNRALDAALVAMGAATSGLGGLGECRVIAASGDDELRLEYQGAAFSVSHYRVDAFHIASITVESGAVAWHRVGAETCRPSGA